jgi:hypothetical protein
VMPPDDVITPGSVVDYLIEREIVNGR